MRKPKIVPKLDLKLESNVNWIAGFNSAKETNVFEEGQKISGIRATNKIKEIIDFWSYISGKPLNITTRINKVDQTFTLTLTLTHVTSVPWTKDSLSL